MEFDEESGSSMLDEIRNIGSKINNKPQLQEDNFDLLRKVQSSNFRKQSLFDKHADSAELTDYATLRKKHQIDLNSVENLAEHDLEDAGLQNHMEVARQQLAEYRRKQDLLPEAAMLFDQDMASRKSLSRIMQGLAHHKSHLQIANDAVLIQASNIKKISNGIRPHGYPNIENTNTCFEYLSEKLMAASDEMSNLLDLFEKIERDLILMRRNYEIVVDGERNRAKHFQELSSHFEHNN